MHFISENLNFILASLIVQNLERWVSVEAGSCLRQVGKIHERFTSRTQRWNFMHLPADFCCTFYLSSTATNASSRVCRLRFGMWQTRVTVLYYTVPLTTNKIGSNFWVLQTSCKPKLYLNIGPRPKKKFQFTVRSLYLICKKSTLGCTVLYLHNSPI